MMHEMEFSDTDEDALVKAADILEKKYYDDDKRTNLKRKASFDDAGTSDKKKRKTNNRVSRDEASTRDFSASYNEGHSYAALDCFLKSGEC